MQNEDFAAVPIFALKSRKNREDVENSPQISRFFILFSDRKLESDLRDGFVSGEAPPAGHNGDIWPRAATKHGANPAAKNSRFLLGDSIRSFDSGFASAQDDNLLGLSTP